MGRASGGATRTEGVAGAVPEDTWAHRGPVPASAQQAAHLHSALPTA